MAGTRADGASAGPAAPAVDRDAAEAFRAVHPERFLSRFLSDGVRPDGRSTHAFRHTAGSFALVRCVRACVRACVEGPGPLTQVDSRASAPRAKLSRR
jgi:hypothetical protein